MQRQPGDQRPCLRPDDRHHWRRCLCRWPARRCAGSWFPVKPGYGADGDIAAWSSAATFAAPEGSGVRCTRVSVRRLVLRRRPRTRLGLSAHPRRTGRDWYRDSTLQFWKVLKTEGVDSAPQQPTLRRADFLRPQAETLLAVDLWRSSPLSGNTGDCGPADWHSG